MFKWPVLAAATLAIALQPAEVRAQQEIETVFAIPSQTLTFATHYVAHDAGLFNKEGLKVTDRYLVGVASPNAVLAGSADFTITTGPVFLRAAAQGQGFKAIANLVDKPLIELVLRKDVADAAGITASMPMAERAKAMKGKTIAIQGVGSIVHAWPRYVASLGGLDIEQDVRIAPMDPPAMLPALESKAVDGYATTSPFTTQAVVKGVAVMLASSTFDAPELHPFANALVYSRPDFCKDKRDLCARVGRAYVAASRMIQEKPDEVLETVLRKRFAKMDPQMLTEAWKVAQKAHARDVRVVVDQLVNSQKVSLVAKLLDPKDALTKYDGLFTDEFVK
ncbi:MAG TPA: ABC transporter substrate-binding protein [Hyphomicrobiaceae bacterium]|jgi:ABC-type nitrate/sulfonate/bicarbonate transport system substrate-binding protein|nr:ABC transporter substrate-binding protein [Hyphomicrobiaceae bacterium]